MSQPLSGVFLFAQNVAALLECIDYGLRMARDVVPKALRLVVSVPWMDLERLRVLLSVREPHLIWRIGCEFYRYMPNRRAGDK